MKKSLNKIGISMGGRKGILDAIESGFVVLDYPLKSMDEIVAFRGRGDEFQILKHRYRSNGLVPIDSLQGIDTRALNVLVHFQKGDEALSNRDDHLFIERLRKYNRLGKTCIVIGNDGGHHVYHQSL